MRLLQLARRNGALRPRDVEAHGIARVYLSRLVGSGALERVGRGLYTLARFPVTEHHSLAEACARVPHGVVCLLSALRFHGLTSQAPYEVWLAIDGKARRPEVEHPPLRIVRMGEAARRAGVEDHVIDGVRVRVTSATKTVVDCFKYRNKLGLDVALEALRDYFRSDHRDVDALFEFAKVCRVANVMRPYLEAMG